MDKLLTIVVPTYNIEQYIEKNIKSFQNVDNKYKTLFEVLIINDGSTDNTVNVVNNLIKEDNTLDIRIISKVNGGHGSTINRGITEAQGRYFKVIDGDDWIDVQAFQQYLDVLAILDVDLVITDFTEQHVYNNTTKKNEFKFLIKNKIVSTFPNERIPMHATTYKTQLLKVNNIRLSEKTFYVDMQYTLFPLQYVKSYYYLPLDIYQYFLGRSDQSMNIKSMIKNAKDHLVVTKSILNLYDQSNKDRLNKIIKSNLGYLINLQFILSYMNNDKKKLISELVEAINHSKYEYKFNKNYKTAYLIYLNNITNYKLQLCLNPIINSKIKQVERKYDVS